MIHIKVLLFKCMVSVICAVTPIWFFEAWFVDNTGMLFATAALAGYTGVVVLDLITVLVEKYITGV